MAATSEATFGCAADRGLPLLLGMHVDDATKRAQVEAWSDRAGLAGSHVGVGIAHVAPSADAARHAVRDALPRWLRPGLAGYVRADGRPTAPRDPDDYPDLLTRLHPLGTAAECAARLARTARDSGVSEVALMVQTTGERTEAEHTLRAIGEHLPELHALGPDETTDPAAAGDRGER